MQFSVCIRTGQWSAFDGQKGCAVSLSNYAMKRMRSLCLRQKSSSVLEWVILSEVLFVVREGTAVPRNVRKSLLFLNANTQWKGFWPTRWRTMALHVSEWSGAHPTMTNPWNQLKLFTICPFSFKSICWERKQNFCNDFERVNLFQKRLSLFSSRNWKKISKQNLSIPLSPTFPSGQKQCPKFWKK